MSFKTILFDLDGTIIDSSEGITKSVDFALKHFGIEVENLDTLKKFIGPPLIDSFKRYYNFPEEQAREAVTVYRSRYNNVGVYECSLYPGIKETLRVLKSMGYYIGLASSKPEELCNIILEHHKIKDYFDDVTGATFDGRIATKVDVLNEFFRRHPETDLSDMVLVGDTMFDVEGAKATGLKCIGVSYGFGNASELLNSGAICIIDNICDLPDTINNN